MDIINIKKITLLPDVALEDFSLGDPDFRHSGARLLIKAVSLEVLRACSFDTLRLTKTEMQRM